MDLVKIVQSAVQILEKEWYAVVERTVHERGFQWQTTQRWWCIKVRKNCLLFIINRSIDRNRCSYSACEKPRSCWRLNGLRELPISSSLRSHTLWRYSCFQIVCSSDDWLGKLWVYFIFQRSFVWLSPDNPLPSHLTCRTPPQRDYTGTEGRYPGLQTQLLTCRLLNNTIHLEDVQRKPRIMTIFWLQESRDHSISRRRS